MGRRSKLKIGDKYGRLTVIDIQSFGAGKHAAAICKCACGNQTSVQSHLLTKIKSCGCSQYDTAFIKQRNSASYYSKPVGEAMFNNFYSSYLTKAKKHKQVFELSKEEFKTIISKNCEYCGREPRTRMVYKKDGSPMYNGDILANGIDRVNNQEGYTLLNSVACCTECNLSKHTKNKEQFLTHCLRVVQKQFKDLLKDTNHVA